jgi:hypothetical protein
MFETAKDTVFGDVTPCSPMDKYQRSMGILPSGSRKYILIAVRIEDFP